MEIVYLCLVFFVIVAVLWMKRPLSLALAAGIAATIVLFGVPIGDAAAVLTKAAVSQETLTLLASFYLIYFLQLMLQKRGRLAGARDAFRSLIGSRRMNVIVPPAVMGILPSAAVMSVCAEMVDDTVAGALDNRTQTFVSSYYRHIAEMFLPTFPAVLLAITLSGQDAGSFIVAMIPLVIAACAAVYFIYLRRIPKTSEVKPSSSVGSPALALVKNLWSLIAVLVLIVGLKVPVVIAAPLVIAVNFWADRFTLAEAAPFIIKSFEVKLMSNMFLVMLFRAAMMRSGALVRLPELFAQMPVPLTASFAMLCFFCTIIAGSSAATALCLPMIFAQLPEGGVPLLVMLMGVMWAGMQISPTHICLYVAMNYYKTTLWDVISRGIVSVTVVAVISYLYGASLMKIFG